MRKTKLAMAVSMALAGSAGMLNTAQAVNVNPDGLGEVLLYPYYTARNNQDTLITITNTTADVKAVKVRFLEGKNTQEVLDFNLYLSPHDVWTGTVVATDDGARLATNDTSCTVPVIPEGGVEFRNIRFSGTGADGEDPSLDRTREGHLEIIEMGVVVDQGPDSNFKPATAATHNADGVPNDCPALVEGWTSGVWQSIDANANIEINPGGLYGHGLVINVSRGTAYSYRATAVDNFFFFEPFHTDPGNTNPSLESGDAFSDVIASQQGATNVPTVVQSSWTVGTPDSTSSVLMHNAVMNYFVTNGSIGAATDWVITFPTKRFHISVKDPDTGVAALPPTPPFTQNFGKDGACEPVQLRIWDRDERSSEGGIDFSPRPPGGNALCWETNVITFNKGSVLGSALELNVDTSSVGSDGWMRLKFDHKDHRLASNEGNTFFGLPVIGFAAQEYVNNVDQAGVLINYGGVFNHAFSRQISGSGTP